MMDNKTAIRVIKNEVKCIIRSSRGCDKKCEKCNLHVSKNDLMSAYDLSIKALMKMQENQ